MEALHKRNAKELGRVIDSIGYPIPDKVDEEASEAALLIIKHSISRPGFMKKCEEWRNLFHWKMVDFILCR
jgi:hypothetical protein